MKRRILGKVILVSFIISFCIGLEAKDTQLTIYNQNFAVVKENRILDIIKGESEFRATDITSFLEPESVVLRDLEDPNSLKILEQNYESDPLSEGFLLRKAEGKIIDFEITNNKTGEKEIVKAKILRSGYVPQYTYRQSYQSYNQQGSYQPIVELNGKIQFGLPGRPIFDALEPGSFLKPTLLWKLWTSRTGKHNVEFSYLTDNINWIASYNAVIPEKGEKFDITGWITIDNRSGEEFEKANVKLIAGDVSRIQPGSNIRYDRKMAFAENESDAVKSVTERSFDEYHLYTLQRPITMLDKETKQIEFIRANNISYQRFYLYDGFNTGSYRGWDITNRDYGTQCNKKVWVVLEFKNSEKNNLGLPLPKGKIKIYKRDIDGKNEFIGENEIDHTPKDETVKVYIGNAFDIVGERKQTNFKVDNYHKNSDESFEIKLRNHKKEKVSVKVIEHLYRWMNWEITESSDKYIKKDSKTIEFNVDIAPDLEKVITYTTHYTW